MIDAEVIEMELAGAASRQIGGEEAQSTTLAGTIERHLREYFDSHNGALPPRGLYDRILREMERPLINQSDARNPPMAIRSRPRMSSALTATPFARRFGSSTSMSLRGVK